MNPLIDPCPRCTTAVEVKRVAYAALAIALLSIALHWNGGKSDEIRGLAKEIAKDIATEAMTVGTSGP